MTVAYYHMHIDGYSRLREYTRINTVLATLIGEHPGSVDLAKLKEAEKHALKSSVQPYKVGAVIYRGKKVISAGRNKWKTHPWQAKFNTRSVSLHAEVDAILTAMRADHDLSGCTIAVSRIRHDKNIGASYPCYECMKALSHVGVYKIVCVGVDFNPIRVNL